MAVVVAVEAALVPVASLDLVSGPRGSFPRCQCLPHLLDLVLSRAPLVGPYPGASGAK